jgi:hypothetical protein
MAAAQSREKRTAMGPTFCATWLILKGMTRMSGEKKVFAKYYGAHLGAFKTPAHGNDPPHIPPNFYYDMRARFLW